MEYCDLCKNRKRIMNHDRLRRKIIEATSGCFLKYGIKNTSMNFVSEVLHISKRTLYQFFPSKRNLLDTCVVFRLEASRKRIEKQCEQSCPIEAIVCMNYGAYAFSRMFYPAFRKDVMRYTEVLSLFDEKYRVPLCRMCSGLFDNAKRRGLVQPECSSELAFCFFENTLLAVPSGRCDERRLAEAYSNAILTYLAGICTDEGRKQLNNILVEIQYEDEDNSI